MLCPACGAANAEGSSYCAKCGGPLAGLRVAAKDDVGSVVVFTRLLKCVGVIVFLMSAFPFLVGLLKTYNALGGAAASERAKMLLVGVTEALRSGLLWLAGGVVFCVFIFILSRSLVRDAERQRRGYLK
jgi:hypothetical protein